MIHITYSGWVAIFFLLQLGGFAALFFYFKRKLENIKEQAMVDARAIAGLINGKK
jgi:hypothetical protein